MKGREYIIQVQETCVSGFKGSNSPNDLLWVLGDIFLSKYYLVYDDGNKRVGFAPVKESFMINQ